VSIWEAEDIEDRVVEILGGVPFHGDQRPFLTVYQLAI
jgi:hypothetical protein